MCIYSILPLLSSTVYGDTRCTLMATVQISVWTQFSVASQSRLSTDVLLLMVFYQTGVVAVLQGRLNFMAQDKMCFKSFEKVLF